MAQRVIVITLHVVLLGLTRADAPVRAIHGKSGATAQRLGLVPAWRQVRARVGAAAARVPTRPRAADDLLRRALSQTRAETPDSTGAVDSSSESHDKPHPVKAGMMSMLLSLALVLGGSFVPSGPFGAAPSQAATDTAAVGICLLKSCQAPLVKCIADPSCLANLFCLQTCGGRPDESACQIRCGDVFESPAVGEFNTCAVSQKQCVPKALTFDYPVPPAEGIVTKFDTREFNGQWYISAGLNKIFDCFPCQVHFFDAPKPGNVVGDLSWRVVEPDGEFVTKKAVQTFVQDPAKPGILYNHDNEFLHYEDDWYILDYDTSEKGNEFILVYYRGRNDAWDGYGGAVLYTRDRSTPQAIIPRVTEACKKAGIDFKDFVFTDNMCMSDPDASTKLKLRTNTARKVLLFEEKTIQTQLVKERGLIEKALLDEEKELEMDLKMVAKTATTEILNDEAKVAKAIIAEEEEVLKSLQKIEKQIFAFEGADKPKMQKALAEVDSDTWTVVNTLSMALVGLVFGSGAVLAFIVRRSRDAALRKGEHGRNLLAAC